MATKDDPRVTAILAQFERQLFAATLEDAFALCETKRQAIGLAAQITYVFSRAQVDPAWERAYHCLLVRASDWLRTSRWRVDVAKLEPDACPLSLLSEDEASDGLRLLISEALVRRRTVLFLTPCPIFPLSDGLRAELVHLAIDVWCEGRWLLAALCATRTVANRLLPELRAGAGIAYRVRRLSDDAVLATAGGDGESVTAPIVMERAPIDLPAIDQAIVQEHAHRLKRCCTLCGRVRPTREVGQCLRCGYDGETTYWAQERARVEEHFIAWWERTAARTGKDPL